MSRSNPHENGAPNPAARWFEWNGEAGHVRYYDKEKKKNVDMALPFTFLLLDQLGSVGGFHKRSNSRIHSNEVKDTRQDVLIVKAFKGGTLAEGLYQEIKDKVKVVGGQFVANCYVAFRNGGDSLAIGSLRFKGGALGAWMDFCKDNRADLYKQAITIGTFKEGKTGKVVFRMPVFKLTPLSDATNAKAIELDEQLQEWLSAYLRRTKHDQVDTAANNAGQQADDSQADSHDDGHDDGHYDYGPSPVTDDDIPF